MAVTAVYPNGIVPWSPRVDNQDTIYAKDPNTLAAEIQAVEGALGANPHIEKTRPTGGSVKYTNVDARMHDLLVGGQKPVVYLSNPNTFYVKASSDNIGAKGVPTIGGVPGYVNAYRVSYDPFGYYNGNDITIKATGWYSIWLGQRIYWWSSGVAQLFLLYSGASGEAGVAAEIASDFWTWDFPANKSGGVWIKRNKFMRATWEGPLQKGQRIYGVTWNGTSQGQMKVDWARLALTYHREY